MKNIYIALISIIFLANVKAQTVSNFTIITTPPSCPTCCDGTAYIGNANGSSCIINFVLWSNGGTSISIGGCCAGTSDTATITSSCGTEVQVCSFSAMTTGINHTSNNDNKTIIYPNPSEGNFTIATNTTEKQILQIFDAMGKEVVLIQNITDKTNINASNLDNGIYYIRTIRKEKISVQKIIIQH